MNNNNRLVNRSSCKYAQPLVTIGIPTYNGSKAVKGAVKSLLAQSYDNIDIFISDNCSTDDTADVCEELLQLYPQVRYVCQPENLGLLGNFEFLLQHAKGKYFMWLSDDDTLAPNVLGKYVDFLEGNPEFSLVSGKVEYWKDGRPCEYEEGFNFNQKSPIFRVVQYYFKVVHGAMYHGLMRTQQAQQVDIRRVMGNDWHFVANMAFLGKIKNFDFVGYRKTLGGASYNFIHYAKVIGETPFAGKFPHLKIAMDAYKEVMRHSSIFSSLPASNRFFLAVCSFAAVAFGFYSKIYPFIIGGRVKRPIVQMFPKRVIPGNKYSGKGHSVKPE